MLGSPVITHSINRLPDYRSRLAILANRLPQRQLSVLANNRELAPVFTPNFTCIDIFITFIIFDKCLYGV
jgi:hypothetical protein